MQPLTRRIAIGGLLVIAGMALICGFLMGGDNGEALIGIVNSVVIGILALMQGKQSDE